MRLTTEQFITKAKEIHDNKYSYDLVEYTYSRVKIKIICKDHGIFEQMPNNHLNGQGCPKCGNIKSSGNRQLGVELFVNRANEVHGGKYDYSLVVYENAKTKVSIICPTHGEYEQRPVHHIIRQQGCPYCGGSVKSTTEQFITKAKRVHGARYDYSLIKYKNRSTKIKIICKIHGGFDQRPYSHLTGRGCQKCYILSTRVRMVESLPPDDGAFIDDNDIIQCKCHYCGKYYKPSRSELDNRYQVMIGKYGGSANFYCSDGCKQECSVYGQSLYPKGFKTYTNSREVQPQLRKMVLERDNWQCQKCGSPESLHCHHLTGVELNPIESADIDNCITLCKECHKDVHKQHGCTYQDYKRRGC